LGWADAEQAESIMVAVRILKKAHNLEDADVDARDTILQEDGSWGPRPVFWRSKWVMWECVPLDAD